MDYRIVYDKTGWKHRMSERPSDPLPITRAVSALLDGAFAHRYRVSIKANTIASRYSARRIEAVASRTVRTIVPFETERECAAECLRQLAESEGCETEIIDTHLPPYDLDMSTVSPDAYIDRIGIELEGGWDESPKHHSLCYDGSVSTESHHVGEIRTRPFRFGEFLNANAQKSGAPWDEFFSDYPAEVNKTCGMHVHVSFLHKGYYAALVRREFHDWFLEGLHRFGKALNIRNESFWKRLDGQNYFCARQYYPTPQINARSKRDCRYTAINYCYSLHRTIEFRVLPMFYQPEIGWRFVLEVGRLINVWLAYYGQAMVPLFATVTKKA